MARSCLAFCSAASWIGWFLLSPEVWNLCTYKIIRADGALHILCAPFSVDFWASMKGALSQKGQSVRFSERWKLSLLSALSLAAGTWEHCALICIWRHFTWGRGRSEVYFCEHFAGVNEARTVFNCSCPHVTYLKLFFPFKDIISSCH